ncbi:MAG: hypothetical protein OEM02_04655 [Desulfobulbaceae bacterium]|nr:hypothetical protein [Desulfobulbaceae bacterium]
MKRSGVIASLFVVLSVFFLISCSGGGEEKAQEKEKGAIKQMTDEVAHEMVDRMNAPKDKARAAVKNLEVQQNKAVDQVDELEK